LSAHEGRDGRRRSSEAAPVSNWAPCSLDAFMGMLFVARAWRRARDSRTSAALGSEARGSEPRLSSLERVAPDLMSAPCIERNI
jgi:hypothetical protein